MKTTRFYQVDDINSPTTATTPFGYWPPPVRLSMGFTGAFLEARIMSYLLGSVRRYCPARMRFDSPDDQSPFGLGGINCYAYCSNDPVNRWDPSGKISHFSREGMSIGYPKQKAVQPAPGNPPPTGANRHPHVYTSGMSTGDLSGDFSTGLTRDSYEWYGALNMETTAASGVVAATSFIPDTGDVVIQIAGAGFRDGEFNARLYRNGDIWHSAVNKTGREMRLVGRAMEEIRNEFLRPFDAARLPGIHSRVETLARFLGQARQRPSLRYEIQKSMGRAPSSRF